MLHQATAPLYLVTGGAGFIGSNLVRALVDDGARVRVLDDFSTGKRENIEELLSPRGPVECYQDDLVDGDQLPQALRGATYVVHLAAIPSVPRSLVDPRATNRVNVAGTLRLLLAAREAGVKRVVVASSSSVYGGRVSLPAQERAVLYPQSPYAASKVAAEAYVSAAASMGVDAMALRFFNVFGPRQDPASEYAAVIPRFIARMRRGLPPILYGEGGRARDFCYVDNVVAACRLACVDSRNDLRGYAFNIGCGQFVTLQKLVDTLNELLGTNLKPERAPARPGDVVQSWADIGLARSLLRYEPQVLFPEGLRRTVEWFCAVDAPRPAG